MAIRTLLRTALALSTILPVATAAAHAQITVDQAIPSLARIHVDAAHPEERSIPRTIFGTFLEPIGNSTYNGLWAEILENPSLEAGLWSAGNVQNMLHERPELVQSSQLGAPLPWEVLNPAQGNRYEYRYGDAANSSRSFLLMGVPGQQTGIQQRVYLPVHRELVYKASVYARHLDGAQGLSIELKKRDSGEVLAEATVATIAPEWTRYSVELKLKPGALAPLDPADFVLAVKDDARILIDQASLLPADAIDGLDPDMVRMVKDMHTPLIRYGGNFTSGYHWRDGVGPIEKRTSMPNIAWGIPEYNTFGTDEFLRFCKLVDAEPQVAVNLGTGTASEAAEWVSYINQHWGDRRGGLLWELGNELWGNWNTGWPTLEQLAPRTKAFSDAIRQVDPKARLIATGQDPDAYQKWNAVQLTNPAGTEDYLSTHFVVTTDQVRLSDPSPEFLAQSSFAMTTELERRLKAMQAQIDGSPSKDHTRIAFTEWLWVSGNRRPSARWDNVAGAITTGAMYNMLLRSSDHVPVSDMTGVIEFAGIWKKRGRVFGTPASYVFQMYSTAAADHLLPATTESGSYSVHQGITRLPEIADVPYLDVTATTSADRKHVTLFVVNRSLERDIATEISLAGAKVQPSADTLTLRSEDLYAVNSEMDPEAILPEKHTAKVGESFRYIFPRASVTRISLTTISPAKKP
ncbi:MAG TPA: alpha-L-arabinofuranosidase C-terminal domain-containing protein [Acidisarcina sp.]|nr:alpha-L-arabinofuranosidase C-terminal domain-containing protein [Acidisarcina sp.]